VVVEYEGRSIGLSAELPPLVGQTAPGTRAKLTVVRGGKPQTVWAAIGELPEETVVARQENASADTDAGLLGLTLADLDPQQRKQLGLPNGVLVQAVANGPAYRAGVRKGDIIVQIDGKPMRNAADLRVFLVHLPKDRSLPLLIRRGASSLFLALKTQG
jgi:serine protease Do